MSFIRRSAPVLMVLAMLLVAGVLFAQTVTIAPNASGSYDLTADAGADPVTYDVGAKATVAFGLLSVWGDVSYTGDVAFETGIGLDFGDVDINAKVVPTADPMGYEVSTPVALGPITVTPKLATGEVITLTVEGSFEL